MLPITQELVAVGRANRPGYAMTPEYITIHNTDNEEAGAGALAHSSFIRTTDSTTSWHFTVDDKYIIQHIPVNENAWHAGDGRDGTGNRYSIGIEICMNPECDEATANRNAADLAAYLIETVPSLKPFPECIKQHYDWTGKDCPSRIRARGQWDGFIDMIRQEVKAVPDWMTTAIKELENRGILTIGTWKGNETLNMGTMAAIIVKVLKYLGK